MDISFEEVENANVNFGDGLGRPLLFVKLNGLYVL
jgi:hypothetical protein